METRTLAFLLLSALFLVSLFSLNEHTPQHQWSENRRRRIAESEFQERTTSIRTRWRRRHRRIQQQQEEIGPVCLNGGWYGRNFNRLITLAHLIQEAKDRGTYVRLYQGQGRAGWYGEWFIDFEKADFLSTDNDIPRIYFKQSDPRKNNLECSLDMTSKQWYYWNFDNNQQRQQLTQISENENLDYSVFIRSLDPSLELVLALLKPEMAEQAAQRLQSYREQYITKLRETNEHAELKPEDIKIVTVHSRTLEGGCEPTIAKLHTFCAPLDAAANETAIVRAWQESCHYTQDYVEQQLSLPLETTLVILLGDGQSPETEQTFTWKDDAPFGVQAAMMAQADFHFGNPASSVDKVVAHWRKGRPIFPPDCYADIVEYYQSTDNTPGNDDDDASNSVGDDDVHTDSNNNEEEDINDDDNDDDENADNNEIEFTDDDRQSSNNDDDHNDDKDVIDFNEDVHDDAENNADIDLTDDDHDSSSDDDDDDDDNNSNNNQIDADEDDDDQWSNNDHVEDDDQNDDDNRNDDSEQSTNDDDTNNGNDDDSHNINNDDDDDNNDDEPNDDDGDDDELLHSSTNESQEVNDDGSDDDESNRSVNHSWMIDTVLATVLVCVVLGWHAWRYWRHQTDQSSVREQTKELRKEELAPLTMVHNGSVAEETD